MKKKSIAKNLLKSLEEAVEIEKGTLKGRETRMALSPPATVRPHIIIVASQRTSNEEIFC